MFHMFLNVCLFVCLFNSYIVSFFRENMRRVIYSDFSCHLYTIKKQEDDDRLNFKSSKTIFLINLSQIAKAIISFNVVIYNRLTFVLLFRFWFAFALSRSYHRMICADFKTIKSFVKWSQNDQVLSDRTFWILSHVWSFYSVFNPCTRKWHSAVIESIIRETWWWSIKMINEWCDCLVLALRAMMLSFFSVS
jgi:hypothetical protein